MNGSDHYQEAERLLRIAATATQLATAQMLAAVGQGHATLALAAATITGLSVVGAHEAWEEALK